MDAGTIKGRRLNSSRLEGNRSAARVSPASSFEGQLQVAVLFSRIYGGSAQWEPDNINESRESSTTIGWCVPVEVPLKVSGGLGR
jgi:hypothetical protein